MTDVPHPANHLLPTASDSAVERLRSTMSTCSSRVPMTREEFVAELCAGHRA